MRSVTANIRVGGNYHLMLGILSEQFVNPVHNVLRGVIVNGNEKILSSEQLFLHIRVCDRLKMSARDSAPINISIGIAHFSSTGMLSFRIAVKSANTLELIGVSVAATNSAEAFCFLMGDGLYVDDPLAQHQAYTGCIQ